MPITSRTKKIIKTKTTTQKKRKRSSSRSRSMSSSRSSSKDKKQKLDIPTIDYIIYNDTDIQRPIVIIDIPSEYNWITKSIAYYQTSGTSNVDRGYDIYSNTWLPTAGIVPNDMMINELPYKKGFVFKMSSFFKEPILPEWSCSLLDKYFRKKYDQDEILKPFMEDFLDHSKKDISKEKYLDKNNIPKYDVLCSYYKISHEYDKICHLIDSYFLYEWQLYASAKLGNGYWNVNTEFQNYVLEELSSKNQNMVVPNIDYQEIDKLKQQIDKMQNNVDNIIEFLKSKHASVNFSENKTISNSNFPKESSCNIIRYKHTYINTKINMYIRTQKALKKEVLDCRV